MVTYAFCSRSRAICLSGWTINAGKTCDTETEPGLFSLEHEEEFRISCDAKTYILDCE